jgi:ATP-dependent 26S proteasome regulatory subunit
VGVQGGGKSLAARATAGIFAIHLRKRDFQPVDFDLAELARLADGFSGAEIEQAVVAATYLAREDDDTLATEHIRTVPAH